MPSVITHQQLVARLAEDTIVLLDAQAPGWFEREHMLGAHRLDWGDIERSVGSAVPHRCTAVAVYCWNTTCTGSEIATALERPGYRNVYRYIGAKQDWTDHGAPLITPGAS
jgi:rhodanese-related sulfurtransferase